MKRKSILIFFIMFFATVDTQASEAIYGNVFSPNRRIQLDFDLSDGTAIYAVAFDGNAVIKPSRLGFRFANADPLDHDFILLQSSQSSTDATWENVWGETKCIRNYYNELFLELQENTEPGRKINLRFRIFDDGVGFRYEMPAQAGVNTVLISDEETQFRLTGDHTIWWNPADFDSYEHLYRKTFLSEIQAVNTPVTMKTEQGLFLSIHEAALIDYAGMTLMADSTQRFCLEADLVPWPDGVKVRTRVPFQTPWRTIQISESAGGLIESNLIVNLNEPNVLDDVSWIEPMKYVGIWWGMHIDKYTWEMGPKHGATTENTRRYIDFASRNNIRGLLVEGWNPGWETWGRDGSYDFCKAYPDYDLEGLVQYARRKGVVLIAHNETGANVPVYEARIDSAFALYERLGIHAVKSGYVGAIIPEGQHHHGQWMVNHYQRVVQKAAEHHIMLDVHEPIKDTGIRRTYPNMMTREGLRGNEYSAWSDGNPPEHETILPFTRGLAGPIDYTPGIFDLTFDAYKPDNRVHTTLAKQLALYVVIYSPLQMAADLPENYENQPAFEFIRVVPTDWDTTIVINGEIGDFVTIARKHGDNWYIGAITDENRREFSIPMDFLKKGHKYRLKTFADGKNADWETNPWPVSIKSKTVTSRSQLKINLAPGGGFAGILALKKQEALFPKVRRRTKSPDYNHSN